MPPKQQSTAETVTATDGMLPQPLLHEKVLQEHAVQCIGVVTTITTGDITNWPLVVALCADQQSGKEQWVVAYSSYRMRSIDLQTVNKCSGRICGLCV